MRIALPADLSRGRLLVVSLANSNVFSDTAAHGCFYADEPTTVGCSPFVSNAWPKFVLLRNLV